MPTVTIEVELPDIAPAETLAQLKRDVGDFVIARAAALLSHSSTDSEESETMDKRLAGRIGRIWATNTPPDGKAWSEIEEAA